MMDNITSLLEDCIKDLYNAENQLVKALPRMAKKATNEALKEAINAHLEETQGQVERLVQIAQMLEIKPSGKVCKGMQGLIEEGKEVLEEDGEDAVLDAALIAAAQKVEHYEISAYGSARALAEQLGNTEIVELLQATLDEESAADEKLTEISEGQVLEEAKSAGQQEEEEEEQSTAQRGGSRKKATQRRR